MKTKSIGIFDSGVGGLTVAKAIHKALPQENIIYFGDSIHLPYGNKSKQAIINYSLQNTRFLISKGVKCIVAACNTASSIAMEHLKENISLPIISVLEPGAEEAIRISDGQQIGVIGTYRTIDSKAYSNYIIKKDAQAKVIEKACPLFVPLIEENFNNIEIKKMIIKEYLDPVKQQGIHTLVLGCTHYPLIKDLILEVYPDLKIVDSAEATAAAVKRLLNEKNICSDNQQQREGNIDIYVNDKSEVFDSITGRLFPDIDPIKVPPSE